MNIHNPRILRISTTAVIATFCLFTILPVTGSAEVGVGMELSPSGLVRKKKEKKPRNPDAFIKTLAGYFNQGEASMAKLHHRGYGRNELIKMLVITTKSGKDFTEIVKLRDKKKKLSEIAETYGLDYTQVLLEAAETRKKIDYQASLFALPVGASVEVSSGTVSTPNVIPAYETPVSTSTAGAEDE